MARRNLVIEVLREYDGKVYSQLRNPVADKHGRHEAVVVDRQRGRFFDQDTIISRAHSLAKLTGYPYNEDLSWPCGADKGWGQCNCPKCAKVADDRAKR